GYPKDNTNMDFIKYGVNARASLTDGGASQKDLLNRMPSLKLANYIFRNNGNNTFTNKTIDWGFNQKTLSSGAAYADLNNDGNMDLIINNINKEAGIYRNNGMGNHYIKIALKGSDKNT